MTRRQPARRTKGAAGCTVTVCRGCCCGHPEKNPGVDHSAQLSHLRTHLPKNAKVRVSDCLEVCERSNVIVVGPSSQGRAAGARPVWLGQVLDQDAIAEITGWIIAGGPGIAAPPPTLDLYKFSPPRHVRKEAETEL